MIRLTLLMTAFMIVWVELLTAIYPMIHRSAVPELTEQQREDAHRRAYSKEMNLYAAQANYQLIMAKEAK